MKDQHLRLSWLVVHLGPSVDLNYPHTDETFQHFLHLQTLLPENAEKPSLEKQAQDTVSKTLVIKH